MAHTNFICGCIALILTILATSQSKAETATTGNLLPNAGDGVNTNVQSSNSTIDGIDSATGFTLNGITDFSQSYNELEAQGTGTVSASGTLVDITTTTQSGNSHTTTTTSLDGGVNLTAVTEVQNCEWSGSSSQCGQATNGRDTFSTTIKILDVDGSTLVTTTQTRNNDAGYRDQSHTYTDTAIHTGEGARGWDWQWQGVDGNNPSDTGAVGPNLIGASLTATLLDINYTPISEETQEEIENVNEKIVEVEEILEDLPPLEEMIEFEQITLLPPVMEIEEIEIKEIKIEEFKEIFETNFKEVLIEENLIEEFETQLIEESITEEEFFEEVSSMMTAGFKEEFEEIKAPPMEEEIEETKFEETTIVEEENAITTPAKEEEIQEEKIEETNSQEEGETNATSNTEEPETTNTQETVQSNEEDETTGQEDETVPTKREVDETEETEGQTEKESNVETVEDKSELSIKDGTVDTKVSSITEKVARIIKKLEAKLKRVDDKLNATAYVLAVGLQSTQPDIGEYINKRIYGNQKKLIGIPNDDFFDNINRIEQQQIYTEVSLTAYTSNDPIAVQNRLLNEIDFKKNKLKAEIAALRSN